MYHLRHPRHHQYRICHQGLRPRLPRPHILSLHRLLRRLQICQTHHLRPHCRRLHCLSHRYRRHQYHQICLRRLHCLSHHHSLRRHLPQRSHHLRPHCRHPHLSHLRRKCCHLRRHLCSDTPRIKTSDETLFQKK